MKHIGSILFSLCLLLLVGCADEIGPYDAGDPAPAPVFTMTAVIGGDSAHMTAGDDGYRMTTNRTSDTSIVGGTILTGEMHDPDCPGCGPEMRIALIHRPQSPAGAVVDSALEPGTITLNPPPPSQPTSRTFAFDYLGPTGPSGPTVTWDFGDGSFGQGAHVEHTYALGPVAPPFVFIFCNINGPGCTSSQFNVVNLLASGYPSVDVQSSATSNTVLVDIQGPGNLPGSLDVDMGDGTIVYNDWSFSHTYAQTGTYIMSVQYQGLDSNDIFIYQRPIAVGPTLPCIAPFTYEEIAPAPEPELNREAVILFKDGQGNQYTSSPLIGGAQQSIEIKNFTPFKENEHGDMVYVVEMEADCWLYQVNGSDSIYLEQGVFQWGLPY